MSSLHGRPEPIRMGRLARLRYFWPPPRPRALVRRALHFLIVVFVVAALCVALLMLAGCSGPQSQLVLTAGMAGGSPGAASIVPPQAGEPVSYRVDGSGPAGASFSTIVSEFPADVPDLVPGEWVIAVQALNDSGAVVLEGGTTAFVASAAATPVSVALRSPAGVGAVDIDLSWPSALVADPRVEATLEREGGNSVPLLVALRAPDGQADCTSSSVSSGWYRLHLKLYDGTALVAGRTELLQVREGTSTSATVALDTLNKPGAPITVTGESFTLYWDPAEPGDAGDPVVSYNLYFRSHGTYHWYFLASTGALVESFTVTSGLLAHGSYDFAVTSVTESGEESLPHTSLDDTADPQTGWYIVWEP